MSRLQPAELTSAAKAVSRYGQSLHR